MNYDFGKNWRSKIVPLLSNPKIKMAIKKGVNSFLRCHKISGKYEEHKMPAYYSTSDGYAELMLRKQEKFFADLKQKGKWHCDLRSTDVELLKQDGVILEEEDSEDEDEDFWILQAQVEGMIFEHYHRQLKREDLESYVFMHSCHWWAPTFELTLAKLVEPKEKWRVIQSDKHSTVVNKDNTRVFDILYWAIDGRLNSYVLGEVILEIDPTLGGKKALEDATLK